MKKRESNLTGLMVLMVFAVFALCVLGVLLTGAKRYETLVRRSEESHQFRTAAQYLTTRVHQADCAEGLTVEDFDGCSALVIRESIDGTVFLTRIYSYDGYLRELFSAEMGSFSGEDGEKLLKLPGLSFSLQGGNLTAQLQLEDGYARNLTWHLRSMEERP